MADKKKWYSVSPIIIVAGIGALILAIWRKRDIMETLSIVQRLIVQRLAYRANFGNKRSVPIDMIIVHVTQGSAKSAADWFAMDHKPSGKGPSSAHYIIDEKGGVIQSVPDDYVAYHAGNSKINGRSIGIEIAGWVDKKETFSPVVMKTLAALTVSLVKKYNIPVDRTHIIGHNEVPDEKDPSKKGGSTGHTDPGPFFPWDAYMASIKPGFMRA